jgi:hypothetical protein
MDFNTDSSIIELFVHNGLLPLSPENKNHEDMKTVMTLNRVSTMNRVINHVNALVAQPLLLLSDYYSKVAGCRINIRQTGVLLNTQLAFFLTVFSDCGLLLRIACMLWLVVSLLRCKSLLEMLTTR